MNDKIASERHAHDDAGRRVGVLALLLSLGALGACSGSDDDGPDQLASYRLTLTNLSNQHPMSPPTAILHDANYHAWRAGERASIELETLAEGGDGSALLGALNANVGVGVSAGSVLAPGASIDLDLTATDDDQVRLSLATMLVNTNDAFSGIDAIDIADLASGDRLVINAAAWDAGTELNTESAASVPGPAANGEGFNGTRDDGLDRIRIHPGVIGADDGLAGSALDHRHRFDNPALRIRVERL